MCGLRSFSLRLRPSRRSLILAVLLGSVLLTSPSPAEDVADQRVHIDKLPRMIAQHATTRAPDFRKSVTPDVRKSATGAMTRAPDVIRVPDFRKRTVAEARKMAQRAALGLSQGNVSPRDEGLALVVAQSPEAGTVVRRGTVVKVAAEIRRSTTPEFPGRVPPDRPPLRPTPSLVKETLYAARKIAAHEGFVVGVDGVGPVDESRAVVVWQGPIAGTRLPPKSAIRVKVREALPKPPDASRTPERPPPQRYVPVPNLMNRTLLDARSIVERTGLRLDTSQYPSEEERRRIVVGQKPLPKTPVPIGTSVSVKVARGPSTGGPPSTVVVAPPTTPSGPHTTAPSTEPFEPTVSTLPPMRIPPPDPRPAIVRVPALVERTPKESERLLPARGLTSRPPVWVVITIVAIAIGIAAGAGVVLTTRAKAKAVLREAGPPPDLRIAVSGDGWQQEDNPADDPILDTPALRLRVRSEPRVEPVDTDFPIVAEEVKRHGE